MNIKLPPIVPVVSIEKIDDALHITKALLDGGISCIEVTLRTDDAIDAIKMIKNHYPAMTVGAGTIINIEQIDLAIDAGADFLVSPGLNVNVVKYAQEKNIIIYPGCTNSSDIELAISLGVTDLKFFPAESSGGINMIKSLCAPYDMIRFMPTGGITNDNINEYLKFDKVIACGGSFLINEEILRNRDYKQITINCKNTLKNILDLDVKHVGINVNNNEDCFSIANNLENLLCTEKIETGNSYFIGDIEILKDCPYKKGYISLETNNLYRAISYYESMNVHFNYSTATYSDSNKLSSIFFEDEVAGYAYKLIQK
ncbi:MAG: bifunctional 4-hydroxy-2-oxoglutarate aldolase/2-dehydro-3-deoxy-phosphogluconate aldolase [bacterium]